MSLASVQNLLGWLLTGFLLITGASVIGADNFLAIACGLTAVGIAPPLPLPLWLKGLIAEIGLIAISL
ncbi:hypothetical protein AB3R30_26535 [Leptolyngbyaceae cyanobacterium UHCC 1019]